MRLLVLLFLIMSSQLYLYGEDAHKDAMILSFELISKLENNTPFTSDDGKRFFGPTEGIPSLNTFLLQQLGYVNDQGYIIKSLPEYSPFGELMRLNRLVFIEEGSHKTFLAARAWKKDLSGDVFSVINKNTIFVFVETRVMKNQIDFSNQKTVRLDYNARNRFFFTYGITVNGKSILTDLGFYAGADRFNTIHIRSEVLEGLRVHLEEMERIGTRTDN